MSKMSTILIASAICILACQFSSAVILRPKWYPYFRRENQGAGESGAGAGQSAAETVTRIARAQEFDRFSVCPEGQLNEDCLGKIVMVISSVLQLNNQRYPQY